MTRELHDHFFKQAKRDGYLSRAAYKLIEIDDKRSILRKGMYVLDCGAAPGSWCQVAGDRVAPNGQVIGVDLQPINFQFRCENVRTAQMDLHDMTTEVMRELLAPRTKFDAVLSDMAPSTTGDRTIDHHGSVRLCHLVLDRLDDWLKSGGPVVMKVFEGEAYAALLDRVRAGFDAARGFKPKASRDVSTEMYIVATGFRGSIPPAEAAEDVPPEFELPKRRPSTGWGA
jgi:23S rRNA (uridine2552-2'-O)-methyltransferase